MATFKHKALHEGLAHDGSSSTKPMTLPSSDIFQLILAYHEGYLCPYATVSFGAGSPPFSIAQAFNHPKAKTTPARSDWCASQYQVFRDTCAPPAGRALIGNLNYQIVLSGQRATKLTARPQRLAAHAFRSKLSTASRTAMVGSDSGSVHWLCQCKCNCPLRFTSGPISKRKSSKCCGCQDALASISTIGC